MRQLRRCVPLLVAAFALPQKSFAQASPTGNPPPPPFIEPALARTSNIRSRLKALDARAATGQIADPQNLALFRFKIEQAHLWLNSAASDAYSYPYSAAEQLNKTVTRAEEIGKTVGDAALWTGSLHERAYFAASDGSAQPYWVFLPKKYNPARKYPLVVFLHGYDPDLTKAVPWLPAAATAAIGTDRGFILAVPYGRRNTDFLMQGEDDTLAVTAEVKKHYSVDNDRVFLMGVSMGGYGVYAVGLHHPDIWAGLTPMAARSDDYLWLKLNKSAIAPWKLPLYDADNPRTIEGNALDLPIYIQHGGEDSVVPVEHARLMYADLKKLGYAVRYREIPGGDHYIYLAADSYQVDFDWMAKLRRIDAPRHVLYTTASLRDSGAYWVRIDGFSDYARKARIEAEAGKDGIDVKTENVQAFTLRPPAWFFRRHTIALTVNGAKAGDFAAGKPIVWRAADPAAAAPDSTGDNSFPGIKSAVRSGPIRDCYRDPILLVYGTQNTADPEADKDNASAFQGDWQRYLDGVPPMKADTEVTEGDKRNYNLVLFGTRQSNAILGAIADRLPVELTPTGYRLGDKNFDGTKLGLILAYPSPFDARRMVIVNSGARYGAALAINHKFDLLPDYIVYGPDYDLTDATNIAVAAGFFDGHWQLVTR